MTDTDAIRTGFDHATWAAGYLLGALLPLLAIALIFAAGWWAESQLEHRIRVARIRRQARASGRDRAPVIR